MSCTASWWFLIPGVLLAVSALITGVEEYKNFVDANDVPGCCAAAVGLWVGIALAGVGINGFNSGCH